MTKLAALLSLSLVGVVGLACSKTQSEPAPTPSSSTGSTNASSGAMPAASGAPSNAAGAGELKWEAPLAWTAAANTSPMRKATYKVGADAEAVISTAGGNIDANIKRWSDDQFGGAKPKIEKKKVNGLDVTIVELTGTFNGGSMMGGGGGPKPGQMMLAAIAESTPEMTFVKLVGPEKTVSAARGDFEKLVSSLRAK